MLNPITVVLTAAGCPGASTCINHLRGIRERTVRVIGADADPEAVGRFLADGFHRIPTADEPGYIDAMVEICERYVDRSVLARSREVVGATCVSGSAATACVSKRGASGISAGSGPSSSSTSSSEEVCLAMRFNKMKSKFLSAI